MYEQKLTNKEGVEHFSFLRTFFLSQEPDLWANPFQNRQIKYRCFLKVNESREKVIIYLCLNNKSKDDKNILDEIARYSPDQKLSSRIRQTRNFDFS